MRTPLPKAELPISDDERPIAALHGSPKLNRRTFVQVLATGLLITVGPITASAQRSAGRGGGGRAAPASRIHVGKDGLITVLTGKVELGQGARAELSQAAAEELRVAVGQIRMVMADTGMVPDDGVTAGSRTTPSTVPAVRQAAAAARAVLIDLACRRWNVDRGTVEVRDGKIKHGPTERTLSYGDLAQDDALIKAFAQAPPAGADLTPVGDWKVLGTSVPRPNARDLVTGQHRFPSDLKRPDMLRGKVLRPPSFGAKLLSVDLGPARAMTGVVAVQDGQFVGVAAPTTFLAEQALQAITQTAKWESAPQPSSQEIFEYLRQHTERAVPRNPFTEALAAANKTVRQTYQIPYVQHVPMETRVALAEWQEGRLTVWTTTQAPFGYHSELARAFRLANDRVRVIVPDIGGGFGGKHTAEAAIEAARLAQAAGKPVSVKWTRQEEFTWAYFRPAAVIDIEATLDAKGLLTSWHFVTLNAGGAAIDTPYRSGQARSASVACSSPLRQGSYRALAATANNFARECFMDELAAATGVDPLDFRLAHLDNARLRAVLEEAAKRFNWRERSKQKEPNRAVGLACGTEKGSVVATCVEIELDRFPRRIVPRQVCEVFECGPILNPDNLQAQVQGCIIMALGPALREEIRFQNGKIQTASFKDYLVPRFSDVPQLDLHYLNRPDLTPVGAGETPLIAVAPAIANAVFAATGQRLRSLPLNIDNLPN